MVLLYITLSWAAGIILAHLLWQAGVLACATPGWPLVALAAVLALLGAAGRRRPVLAVAASLGAVFLLGAWRYQVQPVAACPTPSHVAFYNSRLDTSPAVTLEGWIIGYPDQRDRTARYRLRAERLAFKGTLLPVGGDVLVETGPYPEYRYGDRIRVTGRLLEPPVFDDFDYRAYLAAQGIRSLMRYGRVEVLARGGGSPFWRALYHLRGQASDLIGRLLPEPAAALANGMLLGIEGGIPRDLNEEFEATGASHVIVISGSNVALLSGFLLVVFGRALGRRRAVYPTIACIAFYVLLVGADAPALRAGFMGVLCVLAIALGRQNTAWVSLLVAALAMTIYNPLTLWDAGFQLSLAATLGLVLFAAPLSIWLRERLGLEADRPKRALGTLADSTAVALSAGLAALPLIAYHFGRLSPISPVVNLLIAPAQAPILAGGMASLAAGALWEPLGRLVAAVPWLFLSYTVGVVRVGATLPMSSLDVGAMSRFLPVVVYGLALGVLALRHPRLIRSRPLITRSLAMGLVALLPFWLGLGLTGSQGDGRLHLFFIPAGEGEAAALVTPHGRCVWIWDDRGDADMIAASLGQLPAGCRRPFLTIGSRPASVPASDQHLDPGDQPSGATVHLEDRVDLEIMRAGDQWAVGVRSGDFVAILPTTLSPGLQADLLTTGSGPRLTVLKGPGPGTGSWPEEAWLAATAPQLVVWPEETTYPPGTVSWMEGRGAGRVPADALVEIATDGKRIWLRQLSASR